MTNPTVIRTGGAGQALAQIGEAIRGIVDPFAEQRREFESLIAGTPGALERFAEQARTDPKAFQSQFPFIDDERLAEIARVPETAEQGAARASRETFAGLSPEQIQAMGQAGLANIAQLSPEELATLGPRLAEITRITEEEPEVIARAAREDVVGRPASAEELNLLRADLTQQTQEIINQLPLEEQERIALRTITPEALFDEDKLLEHQRRLEIARITSQASDAQIGNRAQQGRREAQAALFFRETNVASPEAWEDFLYGGPRTSLGDQTPIARGTFLAQQNLTQIQRDTLNQDERDVLLMAEAVERRAEVDNLTEIASQRRVVTDLVDRITEVDRDGNPVLSRSVRVALLEQLNDSYRFLNSVSRGSVPIRVGEIPLGRFEALPFIGPANAPLVIKDEQGNLLDSADPLSGAITGGPEIERERQEELRRRRGVIEESQRQAGPEAAAEVVDLIPDTMFNFQQIDVSGLTPGDSSNVQAIMDGRGSFKELVSDQPESALNILRAFRIQSSVVQNLIGILEGRIPEPEPQQ